MKRFWLPLSGAALVLAFGLDLLLRRYAHPTFWWHATPAFDFLYGLVGAMVLVLGAHWLGHGWLQHPEHYYEEKR